jgi:hypothetical protein
MRILLLGACALTLVACQPVIPESGATVPVGRGVGFENYDAYEAARAKREEELRQQAQAAAIPTAPTIASTTLSPAAQAISGETPTATQQARAQAATSASADRVLSATTPSVANQQLRQTTVQANAGDDAAEIAAQTQAVLANSGVSPLDASPSNPAPQVVQVNTAGISNENDFGAVSERDSIKGNAERIRQQREQYQVVQPTALPTRQGVQAPNIIKYALDTRNDPGQSIYRRTGFNLRAKNARNCAAYTSVDLAQEAFLAAGGPQKDREALDVDGDGFACGWDPRPFRKAFR